MKHFQRQHGLQEVQHGVVDEKTADLLNRLLEKHGTFNETNLSEFLVKGQVIRWDGTPAVGMIVRAWNRDLRKSQPLGERATTNPEGRYTIRYGKDEFSRTEKNNADLVVKVFDATDQEKVNEPLVESPIMFNAPLEAKINLQLPDPRATLSEFERNYRDMSRLLDGQGDDGSALPITALTEEELGFLANETQIDRQHLAWLRTAFDFSARCSKTDAVENTQQAGGTFRPACFYGWFREGITDQ